MTASAHEPTATDKETLLDFFLGPDTPRGSGVTSSRPRNDRVAERHAYARGAVPLRLLVDRAKSTVTIFSEPKGDDHLTTTWGTPPSPSANPSPSPPPSPATSTPPRSPDRVMVEIGVTRALGRA
ncbi:hypothetical protein ACJ6WD_33350 [Streptomyces sp. VTCC 41912]|uniref:hypothetical protein n=1 Tax=Streptomyces sp. VTCC 41912 TaxID=3383243 RepID=UPI0038968FE3